MLISYFRKYAHAAFNSFTINDVATIYRVITLGGKIQKWHVLAILHPQTFLPGS